MTSNFLILTLFMLSISGLFGPVSIAAKPTAHNTALPLVDHPLIYRPASLTTPGNPPYIPSDLYKGYDYLPLYSHGVNGKSTRIAVIDAYGDQSLAQDVSTFDSLVGLPAITMNSYYPDGVPANRNSGWALETALDVEWAHAIAPGATVDVVISLDSSLGHMYDGINYVSSHLTNETSLSMSFGLSESQYPTTGSFTINNHHQLFTTIASHGTSIFASSGDNGASSCCAVSYPASDPLVVAVGGTTLSLNSTGSYTSEIAWTGSGAGASLIFSKPSWQQGLGDSSRDVADVSYNADPNTGVLVVQGGREFEVGGTSAGSPQWAALTALASQAANVRYGSFASLLYSLTSYHDVTAGSDGFFTAGKGWDYPTGLGSPDATQLVDLLLPPVQFRSSSLFQGLNVTTTGNFLVNPFNSTTTGTAMLRANNATTGEMVYAKNYTITTTRLQNQPSNHQTVNFLLSMPVKPYALSADMTLTTVDTNSSIQVFITRRVNISGDSLVSANDISIVKAGYGATIGSTSYSPMADLTGDGLVNTIDASIAIFFYASSVYN